MVLGLIALLDEIKLMFFPKSMDTIFTGIIGLACLIYIFDIVVTTIVFRRDYFCKFFFFADCTALVAQAGVLTAS